MKREKHQEPSKRCHTTANQINDQQLCWQIDEVKKSENRSNKKIRFNQKTKKKSKNDKKYGGEEGGEENNFLRNCEKVLQENQGSEQTPVATKYDTRPVSRKSNRENSKYLLDKFNETVKNSGKEADEMKNKTDLHK